MNLNSSEFPPIPLWQPLKKHKTSSVRIACLAGNRIRCGLGYDCELLLLDEKNTSWVLRYGNVDFVLIDSNHPIITTCVGTTEGASNQGWKDNIQSITELSRKLNIPLVYWITEDITEYQEHAELSQLFDLVYGVSEKIVNLLHSFDIVAEILPPCFQPAINNPFRLFDFREATNFPVLYDGWNDLSLFSQTQHAIQGLLSFGLQLIDSQDAMTSELRETPDGFPKQSILGRVSPAVKSTLLKYCQAYAMCEKSEKGDVAQMWDALEAAGSRVPVVYLGGVAQNDVRKDFVVECASEITFLAEFSRFSQDTLYRERLAHLTWRRVNNKHTFAHRLKTICKRLEIANNWEEHPKISCITPTYRLDRIQHVVETFDGFNYPNKELLLVANTDDIAQVRKIANDLERPNIKVTQVPGELFAGAALNMGHTLATGTLCFRIDDDDYYKKNYILDMVLGHRAVDADVFGKHSAALVIEGKDEVFTIKNQVEFIIHTTYSLAAAKLRIGGNSVTGTTELFARLPYADLTYGAADSEFFFQLAELPETTVAIMDRFNCIATRRLDESTHTWKASREEVLKNRCLAGNRKSLIV